MNAPGRASLRHFTIAFAIAAAAFAYAGTHSGSSIPERGNGDGKVAYGDLLTRYQSADLDILRSRRDASRHRLWILTVQSLYIYDTAERTLLHRVELPAWSLADLPYALPPDLVLNDRGAAFLSSNVEPRLLEIDPSTFQLKEHRLRLVSRPQSETGFGALQFAPDGALLAVGTTAGSRFRIDLHAGTAEEMR